MRAETSIQKAHGIKKKGNHCEGHFINRQRRKKKEKRWTDTIGYVKTTCRELQKSHTVNHKIRMKNAKEMRERDDQIALHATR